MQNAINNDIFFKIATTENEFDEARNLFQEYANSLDIDLSFQDFTNELKTIEKQYNKPKGALLLTYKNEIAIGCVAIREIDNETAELKRMYVQSDFRMYKIGMRLLQQIIEIARELNYKKIRLDTLPTMTRAQDLYRSFGFYKIEPYCFNPISGTVFMEKKLS